MVSYISLVPGNTRLHWALLEDSKVVDSWNSAHLTARSDTDEVLKLARVGRKDGIDVGTKVYVADVVPSQTKFMTELYAETSVVNLDAVFDGQYATMGKDRVLSVLGAMNTCKGAALVIDSGTATTYSGVDKNGRFVGGAILPGLTTQLKSLYEKTEKLPLIRVPTDLPDMFASDTVGAIQSGVVFHALGGVRAFMKQWETQHPNSHYVFTGGDGAFLYKHVGGNYQTSFDGDLMHKGMAAALLKT